MFCQPSRPPKYNDETSPTHLGLSDLIAEGLQVLEHAGLLRPQSLYSGQDFTRGYVTTRIGRSALASGTVDSAIAHS